MSFKTTATIASFGGKLLKLTHDATTTGCEMALNLYLPPNAGATQQKVPVLFYLAGLTCTGDNCAEKGFFQSAASQKGIAIVYPDTSPRTSLQSYLLPIPSPKLTIHEQEDSKSKAKTTPTTSVPAPVSTSTLLPPHGPKTIKWNHT